MHEHDEPELWHGMTICWACWQVCWQVWAHTGWHCRTVWVVVQEFMHWLWQVFWHWFCCCWRTMMGCCCWLQLLLWHPQADWHWFWQVWTQTGVGHCCWHELEQDEEHWSLLGTTMTIGCWELLHCELHEDWHPWTQMGVEHWLWQADWHELQHGDWHWFCCCCWRTMTCGGCWQLFWGQHCCWGQHWGHEFCWQVWKQIMLEPHDDWHWFWHWLHCCWTGMAMATPHCCWQLLWHWLEH